MRYTEIYAEQYIAPINFAAEDEDDGLSIPFDLRSLGSSLVDAIVSTYRDELI